MLIRHRVLILVAFLLSKALHLTLLYATPTQFDLSTPGTTLLDRTVRWDAVYFQSLFETGPRFEHEWVFGPLWSRLVLWLSSNTQLVSPLVLGLILSNVCQLFTALVIYEYTMVIFSGYSEMALKSTVLFIWSSMGVFGTVAYSENFAALMSVIGLYLREVSFINQKPGVYTLSSLFFALAFFTRSNTIVLGVCYLYDLLMLQRKRALVSGVLLGCAVVSSLYWPYREFCPGRPWCDSLIPSLYSFAQSHYWGVGLFKYWTSNNIFNFVVASPVLLLSVRAALEFIKSEKTRPIALATLLFTGIISVFAHIQIIVRISSFLPLQNWYLAQLLTKGQGRGWVLYLALWIPLQTILYSAFLPPA